MHSYKSMRTLKFALEKPALIWLVIAAIYVSIFWTSQRELPLGGSEQATYNIIEQFSANAFPPKISLVREVADWGHLGYYAVYGRIFRAVDGDVAQLRLAGLAIVLLGFWVFALLGYRFTYRNRLNPLWISLSLILLAVNPYAADAAFRLGAIGLLLLFLMIAMYLFERDLLGWSAMFTSAAVLVDFRALLLALAFILTRVTSEQSRLLRPGRMAAFVLPFLIGALPIVAWNGIVPLGEAREWLTLFHSKAPLVRPDGLFYALALLPIYSLFFSWTWGIRARSRAMATGAIVAVLCIPLYFLFPVHFSWWDEIKNGAQTPLGLVDHGALLVAGPYKNLVLFVPWLAGIFLFVQLLLMDVLDRSRWLRYFIIFYFSIQPFVIGVGDREFLIVLPLILLLSLSESLVGEEGKMA